MRISDWISDVCSSDLCADRIASDRALERERSMILSGSLSNFRPRLRCELTVKSTVGNSPDRASARAASASAIPASEPKSAVLGKRVSVRVDFGGRRLLKKQKKILNSSCQAKPN